MGGKTKSAPRTKSNAKPSSSSRSAELLGNSSTFVGFQSYTDGFKALAPGFTPAESPSDTFDANISNEYQLVLRKLMKKDAMTKKKALQEFIALIDDSDLDTLKTILPVWPKYYHNLSNDIDYTVRELSQSALKQLAFKCKRNMAPYLKQLVPVWLASRFDNYAPAATLAIASFNETFTGQVDRTQEVCLHCETEIIDYALRNLTFHTASTISTGKGLSDEEAEQKYQRIIVCSLHTLSFLLERIGERDGEVAKTVSHFKILYTNPKFWSFSKHKQPTIRAAWFQLLYNVLGQHEILGDVLSSRKNDLITASFQHIDDNDPLVAPQIWGCVLLLQTIYKDWYLAVNLKRQVLPKLSHLLRNGCNKNAQAVCPNILPFISNLSDKNLPDDVGVHEFYKQFFDDLKSSIMSASSTSKADFTAIIKAYFECLRYLIKQLNSDVKESNTMEEELALRLLHENIISVIAWCLTGETSPSSPPSSSGPSSPSISSTSSVASASTHSSSASSMVIKVFLTNVSSLVAYWTQQRNETSVVYNKLLSEYWQSIYQVIADNLENVKVLKDLQLEHLTGFLYTLQKANPVIECLSVKFNESGTSLPSDTSRCDVQKSSNESSSELKSSASTHVAAAFVQQELKQLVIKLVRLTIDYIQRKKSATNIRHVQQLIDMFDDVAFYEAITEHGTVIATLNAFVQLIETLNGCAECELLIEIIFKILTKLPTAEQFDYIHTNLVKVQERTVKIWILQRLLSYPLCIEARVRSLLAEPECCALINSVAKDAVAGNNKNSIQILHKCFFQTHHDEILIGAATVDEILGTLGECLISSELNEMTDDCCSFIAQILPVVCSNGNASEASKYDIFLKLFKFSLRTVNDEEDLISEDTLWEITTSWQDALSSGDIVMQPALLQQCADYVRQSLENNGQLISMELMNVLAEAVAKSILCSTENIKAFEERAKEIDAVMTAFFTSKNTTSAILSGLSDLCMALEALKDGICLASPCQITSAENLPIAEIFKRMLLHLSVIMKLICKRDAVSAKNSKQSISVKSIATTTTTTSSEYNEGSNDSDGDNEKDEQTEDYCDPSGKLLAPWSDLLYANTLECLHMASVAQAYKNVTLNPNETTMSLADELINVAIAFMQDTSDFVPEIKEPLLKAASTTSSGMHNITACRSLIFLVHYTQYAQFEENATILLAEDLSEYFMTQDAWPAYIHTLRYLLPQMEQNTFTTQSPIMRTTTKLIWLRAAAYRCLVANNFGHTLQLQSNTAIIGMILQYIIEVSEMQNSSNNILLYNLEIHKQSHIDVMNTVEYINLLADVLRNFPSELTLKNWDLIRIGLSSWVLSVAKSIQNYTNPNAAVFIVSVYKLFAALIQFIKAEKQKSSKEFMIKMIDEWENLFANNVNLVLFKAFYTLCNMPLPTGHHVEIFMQLLEEITPTLEFIDYRMVYLFCESPSNNISLDNLCNFCFKHLSCHIHCMRMVCVFMLRELTQQFVANDIRQYESKNDVFSSTYDGGPFGEQRTVDKWHYLHRFEDYLTRYDLLIRKYLKQFTYKVSEVADLPKIDPNEGFSFLLLWDCIIYTCAHAPTPLRAIYTQWLTDNKYEDNLMHFLFRAMPTEILKNHDSKFMNTELFKGLNWTKLKDRSLLLEKYTCHLYTDLLRKLPALVRRWWNISQSRQKTFVDKLTTNYVSMYICNDELAAIGNMKDKHENMQVSVIKSTREVLAVYSIEDARMELVISLPPNYPLGGVKVDCSKQLGGRAASRNLDMQLTIFLTHQNGTIFDGLTMWKNNLDKKFEGMEECYVCYTVIHQETCQLPKLTCKTCKKKFHGPCLYKWFTTSSKSTCPLCRNVF